MIPPYYGGQGRSARSIRSDGTALGFTILAALAILALALIAKGCSS